MEKMQQTAENLLTTIKTTRFDIQWLSDHFVYVILWVAAFHFLASLLLLFYNWRYLARLSRWFEQDILQQAANKKIGEKGITRKGSITLSRTRRIEFMLQHFRSDYIDRLPDWSDETLKELETTYGSIKGMCPYAYREFFSRAFNAFRDFIPMYPMLGILGTVLAIGCQLNFADEASGAAIDSFTKNFGSSIWTTVLGIIFGISFTFYNSAFVEPKTLKCLELETASRERIDDVLQLIALQRQKLQKS